MRPAHPAISLAITFYFQPYTQAIERPLFITVVPRLVRH